ncbi:putative ribonuclease T2 family [Talaromyces proteolyticus]|uniref:Ribonuclease T2-like n=1 Tax=Talaromyces proteolyticus TaxID=1131652 RepID=A0AAD4KJF8_9EURO|nr:putative ribonuclease T2 family [Talaromyces proteolyticus]KAH8692666.1 putative ribonuclease T2 family [Talaromyces proteolyticus]
MQPLLPGPQRILQSLSGPLGLLASNSPLFGGVHQTDTKFSACSRPELSCRTQFQSQDTCCFNYPGGHFLQTQFWDTDPAVGPDDSWTIHGLWPDHCDGGFDQYCDSHRRYSNISLILVDSGRGDLLEYMQTYWKDFRGDDPDLWEHEWNKHGTCISTLETKCYSDYVPQEEVVDYFDKSVDLFKGLPSFETLSKAGIVPSHDETYDFADIQEALDAAHGAQVTVRCRRGALNEIWYHFNVAGRLQTGRFEPADAVGGGSNCPRSGIRYIPKKPAPTHQPHPTVTDAPGGPEPTGPVQTRKGNLRVYTLNQQRGCLISRGTWFTSGTCATFKAKDVTDGFHVESRRGPCGFVKDIFTCGHQIRNPALFTINDNNILVYSGNSTLFADKAPKGHVQSKIFAHDGNGEHAIELSIAWFET